GGAPETPVYIGGRQYMTNIYNSNPVGGPRVAGVWQMRDGVAVLVAAIGKANDWKALHTPEILAVIPKTDKKDQWGNNVMDITKETKYGCDNPVSFAWSDLNLNGKIDPDEVTFASGETGGLNVTPDLLFVNALTTVFAPLRFTDAGVPVYDVTKAKTLIPDCRISRGSAGDQVVLGSDGTIALSCPPSTYTGANAIYGVTSDGKRWSYPNKWPGLHASQAAPAGRVPDPGELIGVTRDLGLPIKLNGSDAGELWGLNANSGVMYLFTMDGLFVTTLFTNGWIGNHGGPQAVRGMNINDMDSGGEGFYPTITKTADGKVYLQAINHTSSIVRVDGLESVRRLPDKKIKVTAETLKDCSEMNIAREMENISKSGRKKLLVNIFDKAPVVDGKLDDWDLAEWIMLEPKTYAAMAVSQGRLYLAFRTSREKLADNAGGSPWQALFKSGGGLDLMLSPEEPSDKNKSPKAGDQRLLTSKVGEKHQSILYRPLAKGEKKPASFSSPSRTIEFEQVLDVSKDVEFAQGSDSFTEAYYNAAFGTKFQTKKGPTYELSIPLSLLDIKIEDGKNVAGDVGILIGNGTATEQRVYWSNKATTVVCDVPSEAVLTPALWGEMTFKALANDKVVFENFKSLKVGDMPSGSVAAGEIRIEPALKETGMLSISGDCPAGQSAKSLAVMGKGALHGTSLSLPFGKPEGGKGIVASFDIKGGSWNYHTQMCFADAVGKKTQVIDFGPAEKDKDKVRTLEFRQDSGKGWKTVLEIPCKYNEWERIELIWSPTKDGTGGELFLKAGDSEQNMVSIGKTDIVPDTLVLKPGYRINYTNFKISK
ncbi:MAG: hypothetical protein WCP55_06875, partial [Lentisphaerota bacterium]